jgi:FkbM family methyltransferase
MVDVGAHRGTSCRPFLESGWRVLAFEPDVNNRTALSNSIDSFLASRKIEIDPRAVGSENKTAAPYFRSDISSGISGLSAFHESHEISGTVDIVTLREAFKKYQYQQIGFLKIDTEGHDLFVLQGYTCEFGKPTVIECEFEDAKTIPLGYSFHELARFLLNKGYTVFVSEWHPIIRYGVRHDWRRMSRYPCELSDQKGWGNLLAFLNPPTAETLTNAVRKVLKSGLGYDASKPIAQQKSQPNRADNTPTKANVTTNNIPNTFESSTFRIELSRHTTQIDRKVWQYSHSPTPQMVWAAINEIGGGTANREFVGSLQLSSDQQMTVRVSLGRHGNTDYEGCHVVADLYPQSPSNIRQKKLFLKDHVALKIQIEVLSHENSDTSLFTVSDLYLNETLSSIRKGLDKDSFSVRHANELFRDGKFESALGIYLAMLNERHLRMYSDNALMAAKKLGFDSASSLSELLKRFS